MTERIASMYNELQFHASQGKGLPFVAMMEPVNRWHQVAPEGTHRS